MSDIIREIENEALKEVAEFNVGDLVVDIFSGSGTTLFECEKLLVIKHIGGFNLLFNTA